MPQSSPLSASVWGNSWQDFTACDHDSLWSKTVCPYARARAAWKRTCLGRHLTQPLLVKPLLVEHVSQWSDLPHAWVAAPAKLHTPAGGQLFTHLKQRDGLQSGSQMSSQPAAGCVRCTSVGPVSLAPLQADPAGPAHSCGGCVQRDAVLTV